MLDTYDYVPILKGRDGEYGALKTLSPETKSSLMPLLELPPVPWDFEEERPAKTIDNHLKSVTTKIEDSWGLDPMFIDFLWISDRDRMSNGEHPAEFILRTARHRSLTLIPVIGLTRTDEYLDVISDAIKQDKRGVCIRLH